MYIFFSSVLDYLTTGVRENFNLQQVKGFVRLNAPQAKTLGPSCKCACELARPSNVSLPGRAQNPPKARDGGTG